MVPAVRRGRPAGRGGPPAGPLLRLRGPRLLAGQPAGQHAAPGGRAAGPLRRHRRLPDQAGHRPHQPLGGQHAVDDPEPAVGRGRDPAAGAAVQQLHPRQRHHLGAEPAVRGGAGVRRPHPPRAGAAAGVGRHRRLHAGDAGCQHQRTGPRDDRDGGGPAPAVPLGGRPGGAAPAAQRGDRGPEEQGSRGAAPHRPEPPPAGGRRGAATRLHHAGGACEVPGQPTRHGVPGRGGPEGDRRGDLREDRDRPGADEGPQPEAPANRGDRGFLGAGPGEQGRGPEGPPRGPDLQQPGRRHPRLPPDPPDQGEPGLAQALRRDPGDHDALPGAHRRPALRPGDARPAGEEPRGPEAPARRAAARGVARRLGGPLRRADGGACGGADPRRAHGRVLPAGPDLGAGQDGPPGLQDAPGGGRAARERCLLGGPEPRGLAGLQRPPGADPGRELPPPPAARTRGRGQLPRARERARGGRPLGRRRAPGRGPAALRVADRGVPRRPPRAPGGPGLPGPARRGGDRVRPGGDRRPARPAHLRQPVAGQAGGRHRHRGPGRAGPPGDGRADAPAARRPAGRRARGRAQRREVRGRRLLPQVLRGVLQLPEGRGQGCRPQRPPPRSGSRSGPATRRKRPTPTPWAAR